MDSALRFLRTPVMAEDLSPLGLLPTYLVPELVFSEVEADGEGV